jgi:hypothetical protein
VENVEESPKVEVPKPETSRKTVWEILNAPFVLFVMTSFVLGELSLAYQEYATYRKQIEDRGTKISHLVTEIKYRMDIASSIVQPQFTYTVLFTAHGALFGEIGNKTPDDVLAGEYSLIYPEFAQRNTVSLLWELQELRRKASKNFSLEPSIDAARRLAVIWNEETEIVKEKSPGKHDSIWHFVRQPSQDEFDRNLRVIRASVVIPDGF